MTVGTRGKSLSALVLDNQRLNPLKNKTKQKTKTWRRETPFLLFLLPYLSQTQVSFFLVFNFPSSQEQGDSGMSADLHGCLGPWLFLCVWLPVPRPCFSETITMAAAVVGYRLVHLRRQWEAAPECSLHGSGACPFVSLKLTFKAQNLMIKLGISIEHPHYTNAQVWSFWEGCPIWITLLHDQRAESVEYP